MNVRLPEKMTARQARSLDAEIRRQCVAKTRQYELLMDTCLLYVLHILPQTRFGKKKLKCVYDALFTVRKEMQERYQCSVGDNMGDYAMFCKLKEDGIDVEEMFNEHEHRFKAKVTR